MIFQFWIQINTTVKLHQLKLYSGHLSTARDQSGRNDIAMKFLLVTFCVLVKPVFPLRRLT